MEIMPVWRHWNKALRKRLFMNHSRAMKEHYPERLESNLPWDRKALQRDVARLAKVVPRLPSHWQDEMNTLIKSAKTMVALMEDDAVQTYDRYRMSRQLETAWLQVSGVGHAAQNWVVSGHLFFLKEWRSVPPIGCVDVPWLEGIAIERELLGLAIEGRHVWFYDQAIEQRGERAATPVREYDPTEVPSYEFVWDE